MQRFLITCVSALLLFFSATPIVMAADATAETEAKHDLQTNAAATASGEVKKVDKDAGKITLKHGALGHLGMPAMTMVFRVKDVAMLDQVKPGDLVNFVAEKGNGALFVTKMDIVK